MIDNGNGSSFLSLSVSQRRTEEAFGDRIIPHCRVDEKVAIAGDGIHYVISFRAIDKIEGAVLFRAARLSYHAGGGWGGRTRERSSTGSIKVTESSRSGATCH